jgi:3',5'-cyclic AMP phosphodiesterase CpdA
MGDTCINLYTNKNAMKKSLVFFLVVQILLIYILTSCTKDNDSDSLTDVKISIAVVPDIHYTHPSLLPNDIEDSPSLMTYLGLDRKLLEISDPIFRKVLLDLTLSAEKPDILLVPGDLTKDGELIGHEVVKDLLQDLENKGIKVFVVPGNNDILNPDAFSYTSEPPVPVDNITPEQFADIYGDFGYDEAIYRDENSLSYICEPYSNLWILGIDNIKYTTTAEGLKISGEINPATLTWIEDKMSEASQKDITVLAMMHYGLIEHYAGQKNVEPLISDSKNTAIALMNAGIRFIFTGHYHANDIVEFTSDGKTLYDIQTGSLVTPPSTYRIMELDENYLNIVSKRVTDISTPLPGGVSFLTYSDDSINSRLNSFFTYYLHKMFGLPEQNAANIAPYAVRAYKAYFAGDEQISTEETEKLDALPSSLSPLVTILKSVWTDLTPEDNEIQLTLK